MRLISTPVLCNYYLTYRCNATCAFCDIWEKPSPYVTLENARQNLLDLKRLGVKVIDFTGGEPLLHREIDQLLRLAKSMGFVTTLTTNTLLYPKWADRIKGLVDMLHFSLDASTAEKHNLWRGVSCFDHVIESIRIAKSLGERPDILYTAFDKSLEELPLIYEQITQPNQLVLIINPVFDYNTIDNFGGLDAKALEMLSRFGKKTGVYLNQAFIQLRKDGGNQVADPVCKAASSSIVIDPHNHLVLPCYHLGLSALPINGKLFELYRSKDVQELIKMEGKHAACQGCAINCYMQPSFAVELNKYWLKALPSTLKYNYYKGTWKAILPI